MWWSENRLGAPQGAGNAAHRRRMAPDPPVRRTIAFVDVATAPGRPGLAGLPVYPAGAPAGTRRFADREGQAAES